jgi:hypothetical protein
VGDYDTPQRKKMAGKGQALPGGRFPIKDGSDLAKAIRLAGHAKGDQGSVRAYIKRRAAALGLSSKIPSDWK